MSLALDIHTTDCPGPVSSTSEEEPADVSAGDLAPPPLHLPPPPALEAATSAGTVNWYLLRRLGADTEAEAGKFASYRPAMHRQTSVIFSDAKIQGNFRVHCPHIYFCFTSHEMF